MSNTANKGRQQREGGGARNTQPSASTRSKHTNSKHRNKVLQRETEAWKLEEVRGETAKGREEGKSANKPREENGERKRRKRRRKKQKKTHRSQPELGPAAPELNAMEKHSHRSVRITLTQREGLSRREKGKSLPLCTFGKRKNV
ncbi:hypothetical protein ACFX13_009288 [Malus domestica]